MPHSCMSQPGIGKGSTVTDRGDSHCAIDRHAYKCCSNSSQAIDAGNLSQSADAINACLQSEAAQECQNDATTATIMVWMKGGTRQRFGFSTSTAALIMWLANASCHSFLLDLGSCPMVLCLATCYDMCSNPFSADAYSCKM